MIYELKDLKYIGAPKTKNENTYTQCINIITGISGQTYNGFTNSDMYAVDFPATGLDADGIKNLILSAANQFILTKYPNT